MTRMTPSTMVDRIERDPMLPDGPGDSFSGYAVIGLPFRSGHALALRRFAASSLGPAYTSVWHRSPSGRWTFYSTAAPEVSCARYFGGCVDRNVVTPIQIGWVTPWALRVAVEGQLLWEVTLRTSLTTRILSALTAALPPRAWHAEALLRRMGPMAGLALGAGHLNLTGQTPNGHRFVVNPRHLWLIQASRAVVSGEDLGPPGSLDEQASLGDVLIPQRGVFALTRVRLQEPIPRQARGRHAAALA